MSGSSRLEQLREMLADDPDDPFTRYALAMELRGLGRAEEAAGELQRVLDEAPEYLPTYHQLARLLHETGHGERAREVARQGMELAGKQGQAHAQAELEDLLRELEEA